MSGIYNILDQIIKQECSHYKTREKVTNNIDEHLNGVRNWNELTSTEQLILCKWEQECESQPEKENADEHRR